MQARSIGTAVVLLIPTLLLVGRVGPSVGQGRSAARADMTWLFQNAPQYIAPVQYDSWWDELVLACGCVPQTTLEALVWHDAPARGFACPAVEYNANSLCTGQWVSTGDIFIAGRYRLDERVVKHEMLHAMLRTGGHPALFGRLNLGML